MAMFELQALVGKLSPPCQRALERAAELCASRGHPRVEIEHLLAALLEAPDGDTARLLARQGAEAAKTRNDLAAALNRLPVTGAAPPALSPRLAHLLERAWLAASLALGEAQASPGALLLALLDDETLRAALVAAAPSLATLSPAAVRATLRAAPRPSSTATAADRGDDGDPAAALERFTVDLVAEARAGRIDPVRGRDGEIRQVIDVLMRRRQNNPILVGEAGVGKTAVVEGFALRIAEGRVPPSLAGADLRTLDLGLLQAGASVKGEFERRVRLVVEAAKSGPRPLILFIDEAHALVGAGGAEGRGDAANLLKPALARGELRTVAATTWAEYKRHFEKDPALARRFQPVRVEEPGLETAAEMLRGLVPRLERHHGVRVRDAAVREAVRLSHRYLPDRRLPDKAVSVLDTACARAAIARGGVPEALEEARHRAERRETELAVARREQAAGEAPAAPLPELEAARDRALAECEALEARWETERTRAEEIERLRAEAESLAPGDPARGRISRDLRRLEAAQGDDPLVPAEVSPRAVAAVVSGWTGVPLGKIVDDELRAVLHLRGVLEDRIVGQPEALEAIAARIRTFHAALDDPARPVGVFLLAGPPGVGKSETVRALADVLYGGSLVTVSLAEYGEAHSVSALRGAPPGYVGHGAGGVLTEAVRRRPHSVVLLEEAEKAHPDVLDLFRPVFDRGTMEDGAGVAADFRNTALFLTTAVGAAEIVRACEDDRPAAETLVRRLRAVLAARFGAALVERTTVVPFYPLSEGALREIVELKLAEVQRRFWEAHGAELTYEAAVPAEVAARAAEGEGGARGIDGVLARDLLPALAARVLERTGRGGGAASLHVSLDEEGGFALGPPPVAMPALYP